MLSLLWPQSARADTAGDPPVLISVRANDGLQQVEPPVLTSLEAWAGRPAEWIMGLALPADWAGDLRANLFAAAGQLAAPVLEGLEAEPATDSKEVGGRTVYTLHMTLPEVREEATYLAQVYAVTSGNPTATVLGRVELRVYPDNLADRLRTALAAITQGGGPRIGVFGTRRSELLQWLETVGVPARDIGGHLPTPPPADLILVGNIRPHETIPEQPAAWIMFKEPNAADGRVRQWIGPNSIRTELPLDLLDQLAARPTTQILFTDLLIETLNFKFNLP